MKQDASKEMKINNEVIYNPYTNTKSKSKKKAQMPNS